ncbi:hypothetical protein SPOG_01626 [Schizosaccharomyces cryophilus OY26]|uniref:Uncharacterized protein n=1 Tax=Schizosaccharomyces cryophilus (strain OY26 / ATCC MYA-4695 / CBS 11777 / NBRC 106824 / NRRL Y48691) TaxID=653667 RepID=S9XET9_SCHCR|nr:uncharacterized protein SPOG_01626 [Schizosaccharomyces cryophilus OY26]EPY52291.1 hypothetical protein SPOG_01626 [Schizosaccharomyces cryophilus OY26]
MRTFLVSLLLIPLLGISSAYPYGNAAERNATNFSSAYQGANTTSALTITNSTNSAQIEGKPANATFKRDCWRSSQGTCLA